MTIGTVKFFNMDRGYGFINPEDGSKDAFVHISAMERAGISSLSEGQKVEYELQPGRNGKSSAENLKLVNCRADGEPRERPARAGLSLSVDRSRAPAQERFGLEEIWGPAWPLVPFRRRPSHGS